MSDIKEMVELAKEFGLEACAQTESKENAEDRISAALAHAFQYGQFDGAHHKMRVIDQMVQLLAGDQYDKFLTLFADGEDGPDTYEWEVGS